VELASLSTEAAPLTAIMSNADLIARDFSTGDGLSLRQLNSTVSTVTEAFTIDTGGSVAVGSPIDTTSAKLSVYSDWSQSPLLMQSGTGQASHGRVLGRTFHQGGDGSTAARSVLLLTINGFTTTNSNIFITVTVSRVSATQRHAGKFIAHAFGDKDNTPGDLSPAGGMHYETSDFEPVSAATGTSSSTTLNNAPGLSLVWSHPGKLTLRTDGLAYAYYVIDAEYLCLDGCAVTLETGFTDGAASG